MPRPPAGMPEEGVLTPTITRVDRYACPEMSLGFARMFDASRG